MKKFLSILAIMTATVATFAIAQSTAHYSDRCRNNHCLRVRKTTNRIFSFNQYQTVRRTIRANRIKRNQGNRFTFWKNYKQQISRKYVKQNHMQYKLAHPSLYPRINNVLPQPHKIAVRETEYHQNYKWDSLKGINEAIETQKKEVFAESGDGYTATFPTSFNKKADGTFYDTARDLTVEIITESQLNCVGLSFQICASKKNAESRENMTNVKNLSQKFRMRQVKVNGNTVLFPTYQETFESNGQVYFSYTNMNRLTGNIVTLYGFAPTENKFAASNLMETLFRKLVL